MLKKIKDFFHWPLGDLFRTLRNTVLFVVAFIAVVLVLSWLDVYGLLHGTSRLVVFTDHSRANIYIDGKLKGTSPSNTDKGAKIQVHGGNHTVEVILTSDGPLEKYAIEEISIADNSEAVITLELQDRINVGFRDRLLKKYHGDIPKPTMVPIPGGSFVMGDESGSTGNNPPHKVTLSPFSMSTTEVTFDQYDACVVDGGCDHCPNDRKWGRGNRPVIDVSWDDAQQYIAWLNQQTDKHYRLPTEAEWEYAARAGSTTKYSWGDEIGSNRANCKGCGSQWDDKQTAPVGSFAANAFGLYNMHGNVREWCQDRYYDNVYRIGPSRDPQGLFSGSTRVVRGGGWFFSPKMMEAAKRDYESPDDRYDVGFRLVLPVEEFAPMRSAVYAGKLVAEANSAKSAPDAPEPLELWFETIGTDYIRGWLRSGEIVGTFSGSSLNALPVTWPIHATEEKIGPTHLALKRDQGQLHAVLGGNPSDESGDPSLYGIALYPTTQESAVWLARTENDYLVKQYLSEARYWRAQNDLTQASSLYEKALELRQRIGLGQSLVAAEIMDALAGLNFQLQEYAAATEYAQGALAILQTLQGKADHDVLVRTLRLALYYKKSHDYAAAKTLLTEGLAIIETTPEQQGKQAFQTQLAEIDKLLTQEESTRKQPKWQEAYDLGHTDVTRAIRDGNTAEAVRLINASPASTWLVIRKVFREIAEPGKKVLVLGDGEPYPLLAAVAAQGNVPVAQALLRKGAQVDARLPDGSTALMFAAKMHHLEMVRLLLAAGADPTWTTNSKRPTDALGFALERAEAGDGELVALELLQPIKITQKLAGYTVSHMQKPLEHYSPLRLRVVLETAAYNGLGQVVRRMAELGAPLDGRNQLGATLLHYALMGASSGGEDVALYLIDNGADPNAYYATDQQLAAAQAGRFVAQDRRTGKTPLLLAIDEDASDEFIEQLLQHGADATLPSLSGVPPLQLAQNKGRKSLAALLD